MDAETKEYLKLLIDIILQQREIKYIGPWLTSRNSYDELNEQSELAFDDISELKMKGIS